MKRSIGFALAAVLLGCGGFGSPLIAAEWKDSDCRSERDEGGHAVKVCRDQESIGIFWHDDSYVNGWCDDRDYEIEYSGVSRSEALSWVKHYC